MIKREGKIEPFKLALLISCIVHFSLIVLFPGMKTPLKVSPEYLEVSLIRVPPKRISGQAPQIKEVKKVPTVKKMLTLKLPPLKKPPLPGPKLPILPPYAKVKDEVKISTPAPELELPFKREMEYSPYPPRFFMERGNRGVEYGIPKEGYLPPRATLLPEEELAYEGEQAPSKGTAFSPIKGPLGTRKILRQVEPVYPEWAERQGIEGSGELKLWVLPSGEVCDIEVVRSSGSKLDECAAQALRQWRFEPVQGKEVQWGIICFYFRFKK